MGTTRTFLSWFRQGLGSLLATEAQVEQVEKAADGRARVKLTVRAQINDEPVSEDPESKRPTFYLYGPGDILGFDSGFSGLVGSVWPPHQSSGAEPNFFPTVEFALPDLPWAFSPAAPVDNRLIPWLCLVVVEKREGQVKPPGAGQPLLKVNCEELPDLKESWAWAHVQITHDSSATATIADHLTHPERALSRLICPRRLKSATSYLACVVPVYHDGVTTGGGAGDPSTDTAALAWNALADREITLPVHYSWEFSTGIRGDFEYLVRQLEKRILPVDPKKPVGVRPLDLTQAGQGLVPSFPSVKPLISGALGVGPPAPFPDPAFQQRLTKLINARTVPPADSTLVIAPPTYGASHAAASEVGSASENRTPWLNGLNRDPRFRVAAALGTRVVQERQDDLMARAWEQVGEVQAANQIIRQGQLAMAVGLGHHDQLKAKDVSDHAVVALTSPAHLRVPAPAGTVGSTPAAPKRTTIKSAIATSDVPAAAFTGTFRRMVRPRGPLARRAAGGTTGIARWNERLLDRLNGGTSGAGKPGVRLESDGGRALIPSQTDTERRNGLAGFFLVRPHGQTPEQLTFVDVLASSLDRVRPPPVEPRGPPRTLDFARLAAEILKTLDPSVTVLADVNARLELPGGPLERLDVIMAAPEFPEPMYAELLRLSPEWLLPGIGEVPPNTIAGLYAGAAFIEAFMVGLNHEMGRELLWRGYPTDQRGTYFKQFWDPSSRVPLPPEREQLNDIQTPIHLWRNVLGENLATGGTGFVVLIIRGELLQRFPHAAIYLVPAKRENANKPRTPDASAAPALPEFRAFISPDVTFLGFRVSAAVAKGEPGYFFVIEQPPMEPRFGLDEPDPKPLNDWSDLDWDDVGKTIGDYIQLSGGLNGTAPAGPPVWGTGSTAAQVAEITMQTAVRIAIHASNVLP